MCVSFESFDVAKVDQKGQSENKEVTLQSNQYSKEKKGLFTVAFHQNSSFIVFDVAC